jgi:hypothetical protein
MAKACCIETVVMQATGVYWPALYDVPESYGLQVNVVNARHYDLSVEVPILEQLLDG